MARDIYNILIQLEWTENVHVIAHSMGGKIAMQLIAEYGRVHSRSMHTSSQASSSSSTLSLKKIGDNLKITFNKLIIVSTSHPMHHAFFSLSWKVIWTYFCIAIGWRCLNSQRDKYELYMDLGFPRVRNYKFMHMN